MDDALRFAKVADETTLRAWGCSNESGCRYDPLLFCILWLFKHVDDLERGAVLQVIAANCLNSLNGARGTLRTSGDIQP